MDAAGQDKVHRGAGCALATKREHQIASYTPQCLEAGATPSEVMEAFRLATVMAECPPNAHRAISQKAIHAFGQ